MRRPRLTRKRIEQLNLTCSLAEAYFMDAEEDEYSRDFIRDVAEAGDFVAALSRWHRQKTNERKTK
jgi:hypothetical protein